MAGALSTLTNLEQPLITTIRPMQDKLPAKTQWTPSVTVAAIIEQDGRFLLVEEETSDGLRLNTRSSPRLLG